MEDLYFRVNETDCCRNWKTASVEIKPHSMYGPQEHIEIKAAGISQIKLIIAQPISSNPGYFLQFLVCENQWMCNKNQYRYLVIQNMPDESNKSMVCVTLTNSTDNLMSNLGNQFKLHVTKKLPCAYPLDVFESIFAKLL